jgi:hypothetical protein
MLSLKRKIVMKCKSIIRAVSAFTLICQHSGAAAPDERQFVFYHCGSGWGNGITRVCQIPVRNGLSAKVTTLQGKIKQLSETEEDQRKQHKRWIRTLESLEEKVGAGDRAAIMTMRGELQRIRGTSVERRAQAMRELKENEVERLAGSIQSSKRLCRTVAYLEEEHMSERRQREVVVRAWAYRMACAIECYVGGPTSKTRLTEKYMAELEVAERKARMGAAQDLAG